MSSITLQINPALELKLREKAARKGVGLDVYVQALLEKFANTENPESRILKSNKEEEDLLKKISLGLSEEFWVEYKRLVEKRQYEIIDDEELACLIEMTRQVESANAKRLEYLAALARLRNVSLPKVMEQLGIKPESYA